MLYNAKTASSCRRFCPMPILLTLSRIIRIFCPVLSIMTMLH